MEHRKSLAVTALAAILLAGSAAAAEISMPLAPLVYPAPLTPFQDALSAGLAGTPSLLAAYAARSYAPLWTGDANAARREALFAAVAAAGDEGLPVRRYKVAELARAKAGTERATGALEAQYARVFAAYMRDLTGGALNPKRVDPGIVRDLARRDTGAMLRDFAAADAPLDWMKAQTPADPQYRALRSARARLVAEIAAGGWGKPVPERTLRPGDSGAAVVALRKRLRAMGYGVSGEGGYDPALRRAVAAWQADIGAVVDGVAGPATLAALNVPPEDRLRAVLVAMERMRWMNGLDLGARHVWVNIPDFTARIVDHGETVFETVTVVGKDAEDRHTPEFSDEMETIVINPTWHVPRSITVKEYLPKMQRDPNAASQIVLIDKHGRTVPRSQVNFAAYDAQTFPYRMRQQPSDDNALGLVKFLFPNPWNIYLHDTPSKGLFAERIRAFSHGCIRIGKPFDLAYALLAPQKADSEEYFQGILQTGKETPVRLDPPVPVHLVYFTAWPGAEGRLEYRGDVYGRDAALWAALEKAGVELGARAN